MRVAFDVSKFPALSETFILNQITGLLDRGLVVDIFARGPGGAQAVHPDVLTYKLDERTRYLLVPGSRIVRLTRGVELIARNLWKAPSAVLRSLNAYRFGRSALSLSSVHTAVPFLDGYDIVHCQYGTNGQIGMLIKELGLASKLVVTFHGYDLRKAIKKGPGVYRRLFHWSDCVIAISPYNFQHLVALGADPMKVVCHPVGVDTNRFSPAAVGSIPQDGEPVRLMTVARLTSEKGLEYAVRGVGKLIRERPELNIQYDIIGAGPLEGELAHLIDSLKLGGIVFLRGAQDQTRIVEALRRSHIFLLPSIAEALPVALMEAQAVGLPVIATAVGSADRIVLDGRSGFLVPPMDADAIAERLELLLTHPEKWPEMGLLGRDHVELHFDIGRLNDRLVQIYSHVLADRVPQLSAGARFDRLTGAH